MRKAATMRRGEPKYLPDPDEPTDAERALAVLDRLDTMPGVTSVTMWREWGVCVVKAMIDAGPVGSMRGEGPTPAAALLALGARLEGQNGPESDERFSHDS